jgi:hypothetical protein
LDRSLLGDDEKIVGPVSQHLCLFYKVKIDETFDRLLLNLNPAEVDKVSWASLDQLNDCFNDKHSDLPGYQWDEKIWLHENPSLQVNTNKLWPLFQSGGD